MSSGLVTVKCTNCHQDTEVFPGTIVAECDHCGRLFRPAEDGSAPAVSPFSSDQDAGAAAPPWERGSASAVKPPWEGRPELTSTTPSALPMELDGSGRSARHAQEADTASAKKRDRQERELRDYDDDLRKSGRSHSSPGLIVELPDEDLVEQPQQETSQPAARPARQQPAAPAPTASAAPAIFIFITLLVLAIGAYIMAKREEAAPSKPKTERRQPRERGAQDRGGRRDAPQDEPAAVVSEVPAAPTDPAQSPAKSLTTHQRIGMEQVEKHSVVLSAEQVEKVKRLITHREAQPFTNWGAPRPELEVVVFAPFTNMGIARLRQMTTEFKKLEPFENRIAVWIVYHWGSEKPVEAEAADLAHAIHWTFKREAMHHFVTLLQKEAIWRAGQGGKLDEYVRTVGLDPARLRESMAKLPLAQVRKEVTDLMEELHLPDKDLTFLIGGRSYLDGKTLYHVSKIVDYELAAREP